MFCKLRNIFSVTALSFGFVFFMATDLKALVTLSEEAAQDDINQGIPNESDMFNDPADKAAASKTSADSGAAVDEIFAPKKIQPKTGLPAAPAATPEIPASAAQEVEDPLDVLQKSLDDIDDAENSDSNLFSQMSDIEKQTALLNLELRREKIKTEIEAIKNQRRQAIIQEQEKKEAQAKQKIEWEKAQEQKVLQEQQKLRELDIEFEKLRQERLLGSYKNKYLEDVQKWIAHDASLYKQIEEGKQENQKILEDSQAKLQQLKNDVSAANTKAQMLISRHKQKLEDLNSQISVLKARVIAQEKEIENSKKNPFEEAAKAEADKSDSEEKPIPVAPELKLAQMYAVMEIRGQGGELIAKLINQDGTPFYVKKGTSLQSGHTIDEITSTYIRADKGGVKDYLYFAAGGILPLEQPANTLDNVLAEAAAEMQEENKGPDFRTSASIPGVGSAMMVR